MKIVPISPVETLAKSESLDDTHTVGLRSTIMAVVGAAGSVLVLSGWVSEDVKNAAIDQIEIVVPALIALWGIVSGAVAARRATSPADVAKVALENREQPFLLGTGPDVESRPRLTGVYFPERLVA